MGNIIDEIQKLIKTEENAEQTLIDYIKESNDKELLTKRTSKGKTLIDIALDEEYENFLCAVLEKFPELATTERILFYAANKGMNKVLLKALEVDNLELGLAKVVNKKGNTFLRLAANKGMREVLLKALEVDPSLAKIQNRWDDTFLHLAANKGMREVLLKALEVDPSLAKIQNRWDDTFLHLAANKGMREVLLKALEVDPSLAKIQNRWDDTFLHLAADKGMSNVIIKALEIDPSLAKIQNKWDDTFLHLAAEKGLSEVLLKALEVDNPELGLAKVVNKKGNTFLHEYAICEESKEILEKISPELWIKNKEGLDPIDIYNCNHGEKIKKPKEALSSVLASRAKSLKDKDSGVQK